MTSVAVDAVAAKHSGAGVVARGIVAAAIEHDGVDRITVFASKRAARDFDYPDSAKVSIIEVRVGQSVVSQAMWALWGLRRAVRRSGAGAVLGLGSSHCRVAGIATIAFVQQSVPFSPEAVARYPIAGRLKMSLIGYLLRRAARLSDRVIVQTNEMRDVLCIAAGIDRGRIAVCAPPTPSLAPDSGADMPMANRALYVGNASPYKNLNIVMSAMSLVSAMGSQLSLTAVGPGVESHETTDQVRCLPMSSREELSRLYRSSTFLVMPSLVETVGLPMLEAMAAGLPVLAADRPYAREICGDAAIYFDPLDANSLATAAARLAEDAQLRVTLAHRGSERIRARIGASYACVIDEVLAANKEIGGSE